MYVLVLQPIVIQMTWIDIIIISPTIIYIQFRHCGCFVSWSSFITWHVMSSTINTKLLVVVPLNTVASYRTTTTKFLSSRNHYSCIRVPSCACIVTQFGHNGITIPYTMDFHLIYMLCVIVLHHLTDYSLLGISLSSSLSYASIGSTDSFEHEVSMLV